MVDSDKIAKAIKGVRGQPSVLPQETKEKKTDAVHDSSVSEDGDELGRLIAAVHKRKAGRLSVKFNP